MSCLVSIGEGSGFSSGVNRYCFHSHAAGNKRKLNGSREKTMLAILAPLIALLLFLISLSSYLRLKKRAKKGKTRLSNLYLDMTSLVMSLFCSGYEEKFTF
jgi:hypothetical protein